MFNYILGEKIDGDIFKKAKERFNLDIDQKMIKIVYVMDKQIILPKGFLTLFF
jgi:hypothetical protein